MTNNRNLVDYNTKLNFGKFNKRALVEMLDKQDDGLGGFEEKWCELQEIWVQIMPVRASDIIQMNRKENKLLHKIYTRYQPCLLRQPIRLKLKDRMFHVEHIININEENKFIEILAEELSHDHDNRNQ